MERKVLLFFAIPLVCTIFAERNDKERLMIHEGERYINLLERPAELQGRVFERLFQTAEIAKFDENELREYEQSVNAYRDIKNGIDTAKAEGIKEGMEKGREEGRAERNTAIARNLKKMGLATEQIAQAYRTPTRGHRGFIIMLYKG